jgi:hypothetical protein
MDTVAFDHLSALTGVDIYSKGAEQRDTLRRSLGAAVGLFLHSALSKAGKLH